MKRTKYNEKIMRPHLPPPFRRIFKPSGRGSIVGRRKRGVGNSLRTHEKRMAYSAWTPDISGKIIDLTIPRLTVYLFGKFFITVAGTMLYIYTLELYPTEYRHTLLGFSSMIGRIGSILAPLTPALMSYYHGLPSLLFGGMGVLAGLLVLTQPETLGCKMPDTLAEAEALGKPQSRVVTISSG